MRAMRARGFNGYGRALVRMTAAGVTPLEHAILFGQPIVANTFPLAEASDALRYLVEGRPFGKVVLPI